MGQAQGPLLGLEMLGLERGSYMQAGQGGEITRSASGNIYATSERGR